MQFKLKSIKPPDLQLQPGEGIVGRRGETKETEVKDKEKEETGRNGWREEEKEKEWKRKKGRGGEIGKEEEM